MASTGVVAVWRPVGLGGTSLYIARVPTRPHTRLPWPAPHLPTPPTYPIYPLHRPTSQLPTHSPLTHPHTTHPLTPLSVPNWPISTPPTHSHPTHPLPPQSPTPTPPTHSHPTHSHPTHSHPTHSHPTHSHTHTPPNHPLIHPHTHSLTQNPLIHPPHHPSTHHPLKSPSRSPDVSRTWRNREWRSPTRPSSRPTPHPPADTSDAMRAIKKIAHRTSSVTPIQTMASCVAMCVVKGCAPEACRRPTALVCISTKRNHLRAQSDFFHDCKKSCQFLFARPQFLPTREATMLKVLAGRSEESDT